MHNLRRGLPHGWLSLAASRASVWRSYLHDGLSPSFNFFLVWTVRRRATSVEEKAPQKRGAYC